MRGSRKLSIIGTVLLVLACVVPCWPLVNLFAALPYQDPTAEMLKQQHDDENRARAGVLIAFAVAIVLIVAGVWMWRQAVRRRAAERSAPGHEKSSLG